MAKNFQENQNGQTPDKSALAARSGGNGASGAGAASSPVPDPSTNPALAPAGVIQDRMMGTRHSGRPACPACPACGLTDSVCVTKSRDGMTAFHQCRWCQNRFEVRHG